MRQKLDELMWPHAEDFKRSKTKACFSVDTLAYQYNKDTAEVILINLYFILESSVHIIEYNHFIESGVIFIPHLQKVPSSGDVLIEQWFELYLTE